MDTKCEAAARPATLCMRIMNGRAAALMYMSATPVSPESHLMTSLVCQPSAGAMWLRCQTHQTCLDLAFHAHLLTAATTTPNPPWPSLFSSLKSLRYRDTVDGGVRLLANAELAPGNPLTAAGAAVLAAAAARAAAAA